MVQKVKDRLIGGAIGTISGIIVGLTLFFFGGVRTNANSFKDLVDSKLDKSEFKEYKIEHDNRHEREIKTMTEDIKETKEMVMVLYKKAINDN